MKTTLNKIRAHSPCAEGWAKLLRNLGKTKADDEPLSIAFILESNGLDDALWCLRAVDGYQREMRLFAVDCARSVQHLINDPRNIAAIDVAERHANGTATDEELRTARYAASEAAGGAAWGAAWAAAWVAVRITATDAALAARGAAWGATWGAAWVAATDAAQDAAREIQANLLAIVCAEIEYDNAEKGQP